MSKNALRVGVFGPLPGLIGNFQVIECVKYVKPCETNG